MRAEDYRRRREEVSGWPVGIASYRLGDRYVCEVDEGVAGARIARGEGASREEAEQAAVGDAARRLAKTRVRDP